MGSARRSGRQGHTPVMPANNRKRPFGRNPKNAKRGRFIQKLVSRDNDSSDDDNSNDDDDDYSKVRSEDDEEIDSSEAGSSGSDDSASDDDSDPEEDESNASGHQIVDLSENEDSEDDGDVDNSEDDGDVDQLDEFIMSQSKPQTKHQEPGAASGRQEQAESRSEGLFNARSDRKLDISDLLGSMDDKESRTLAKQLGKTSSKGQGQGKSHLDAKGPMSAPLSGREQDKLDRQAAFGETSKNVDAWNESTDKVRGNQRFSGSKLKGTQTAPLNLTLAADHEAALGDIQRKSGTTTAELGARFGAKNDLERAVESAVIPEQPKNEEDSLQAKGVSAADIRKRQAELRHQRDLLFRAERKAKRVSKIKSRTFRKIHRKAEQREAAKRALAGESLEDEDPLAAAEKHDIERARERASLKHSSKGSRWAKQSADGILKGTNDGDAFHDMLRREQALRKKIDAHSDSDASDASDASFSDDDDDDNSQDDPHSAFDELAQAEARDKQRRQQAEAAVGKSFKGVMGMKFMQDAQNRRLDAAKADEAEIRKMLGDSGDEPAQHNIGRMVFGPDSSLPANTDRTEAAAPPKQVNFSDDSDAESGSDQRDISESNPWLHSEDTAGPAKKSSHAVTKNSSAADKSSVRLSKDRKPKEKDELVVATPAPKPQKKADVDFSSQRELISEAFKDDNIVAQDFAEMKRQEIDQDAPKDQDITLPGWGSWGGKGVRKNKPQKKFIKKIPGLAPELRKDAGKDHVIISEKKNRHTDKYLVDKMPYPYSTPAQYEKNLSVPIGPEWNTQTAFRDRTMPEVLVKPGVAVRPIDKPL